MCCSCLFVFSSLFVFSRLFVFSSLFVSLSRFVFSCAPYVFVHTLKERLKPTCNIICHHFVQGKDNLQFFTLFSRFPSLPKSVFVLQYKL